MTTLPRSYSKFVVILNMGNYNISLYRMPIDYEFPPVDLIDDQRARLQYKTIFADTADTLLICDTDWCKWFDTLEQAGQVQGDTYIETPTQLLQCIEMLRMEIDNPDPSDSLKEQWTKAKSSPGWAFSPNNPKSWVGLTPLQVYMHIKGKLPTLDQDHYTDDNPIYLAMRETYTLAEDEE